MFWRSYNAIYRRTTCSHPTLNSSTSLSNLFRPPQVPLALRYHHHQQKNRNKHQPRTYLLARTLAHTATKINTISALALAREKQTMTSQTMEATTRPESANTYTITSNLKRIQNYTLQDGSIRKKA